MDRINTMKNAALYSGTSGIVAETVKALYPAEFRNTSRLHYYSTLFNSLEINSTFYKLPKKTTVGKWMTEVTPGFRFTFKIPKAISHSSLLQYDEYDVRNFCDILADVSLPGCILIQLPSGTTCESHKKLTELIKKIGKYTKDIDWRIAVEFRHSSWYSSKITESLKHHNVAVVLHDFAKGENLQDMKTADFVYLRFHGPEPRYRGSYSDEFLLAISKRIQQWISEGRAVFAYFNNTMGAAYDNIITLNELVRTKQIK
ncbi:MAG: DUF72 domain-containing protein [Chitinophagaceae bacterium]|nr:MAG: DUF72 domain-containing protein [Chitinophagaceae bacterium]